MTRPYFEQLNNDLWSIGVNTGYVLDHQFISYTSVDCLLRSTCLESDLPQPSAYDESPQTELAQHFRAALEHGVTFRPRDFPCCPEAEPCTINSTARSAVKDPWWLSPVVVTKGKQPMAIIKAEGEKTCYVLEDDFERGLVAGTFTAASENYSYYKLPNRAGAWRADISSFTFQTIRFSIFATPIEARKNLRTHNDDQRSALGVKHQDLIQRAHFMLKNALPATVNEAGLLVPDNSVRDLARAG